MTVDPIKEAISRLPDDERHSLAAWLNEIEYDDWDRKMVADFSAGGRGMALVEAIEREAGHGKIDVAVFTDSQLGGQFGRVEHVHRDQVAGGDSEGGWHRGIRWLLLPESER